MTPDLLEILRCPKHPHGEQFVEIADGLECPECGAQYPVVEGIPILLDSDRTSDSYRAAEQQQWDVQAETYEVRRVQDLVYKAGIESAISNLGVRPGDRVLDAGCGTGLTVRSYHHSASRTVALDLSLQSLLYLKRRLPTDAKVNLVCGDLTALPFTDGYFDKVLCANALQHLPDETSRRETIAELARVASVDARVVVTAHNYAKGKERKGWPKEGSAGGSSGPVQFIHRFVAPEFETLLGQSLRVQKVTGAGLPLPYRFKLSPLMCVVERVAGRFRWSTRWSNMLVGIADRC